jgi:hypothetical protein
MHIVVRSVLLVLVLGSSVAVSAGQSYMTLVGELMGAVESPRAVRDFCTMRSPATAAKNARLYADWKERHKALLDSIDEQIAHANVRLKKQGAPGGDNPAEFMLMSVRSVLEERLDGMSKSQVKDFCGNYSAMIKSKDEEASTSIPRLLEVVTHADKVLAERERT